MNILDRVSRFRTAIAENFVRMHDLGGPYLQTTRLCLSACRALEVLVLRGSCSQESQAVGLHVLAFAESTFALTARVGTDALDSRIEGRLEALQHMLEPLSPPADYPLAASTETQPGLDGVLVIADERKRQQERHGYSREADVSIYAGNNELAQAAACYAMPATAVVCKDSIDFSYDLIGRDNAARVGVVRWPWPSDSYSRGERVRELAKAGALIAAAIDVEIAKSKPN